VKKLLTNVMSLEMKLDKMTW